MMMLIDPFRYGGGGPVRLENIGTSPLTPSSAGVVTIDDLPLGSPGPDRTIVLSLGWLSATENPLVSAELDGVPAQIAVQETQSNDPQYDFGAAICAVRLPAGSSGDLALTFHDANTVYAWASVIRALGATSVDAFDAKSLSFFNDPAPSVSIDTEADGAVVAGSVFLVKADELGGITQIEKKGEPETVYGTYAAGMDETPTAQTGRQISLVNVDSSGGNIGCLIAASFR